MLAMVYTSKVVFMVTCSPGRRSRLTTVSHPGLSIRHGWTGLVASLEPVSARPNVLRDQPPLSEVELRSHGIGATRTRDVGEDIQLVTQIVFTGNLVSPNVASEWPLFLSS